MYFSSIFSKAGSNIAEYKNDKIYSCFFYEKKGKHRLKLKFLKKNNQINQCIILAISADAKINVCLDGKNIPIRGKSFQTIDLFEEEYGTEFILDVELIEGRIGICNGHEKQLGDKKIISYMSRGHAMLLKIIDNKYIFTCNSAEDEDDFDDLEFEMEILD